MEIWSKEGSDAVYYYNVRVTQMCLTALQSYHNLTR